MFYSNYYNPYSFWEVLFSVLNKGVMNFLISFSIIMNVFLNFVSKGKKNLMNVMFIFLSLGKLTTLKSYKGSVMYLLSSLMILMVFMFLGFKLISFKILFVTFLTYILHLFLLLYFLGKIIKSVNFHFNNFPDLKNVLKKVFKI